MTIDQIYIVHFCCKIIFLFLTAHRCIIYDNVNYFEICFAIVKINSHKFVYLFFIIIVNLILKLCIYVNESISIFLLILKQRM